MTDQPDNQPARPVRGIGSIIAALMLGMVGLLFLLASACFGVLGIASFTSPSNRELSPWLLLVAVVCSLVVYRIGRSVIRILKQR